MRRVPDRHRIGAQHHRRPQHRRQHRPSRGSSSATKPPTSTSACATGARIPAQHACRRARDLRRSGAAPAARGSSPGPVPAPAATGRLPLGSGAIAATTRACTVGRPLGPRGSRTAAGRPRGCAARPSAAARSTRRRAAHPSPTGSGSTATEARAGAHLGDRLRRRCDARAAASARRTARAPAGRTRVPDRCSQHRDDEAALHRRRAGQQFPPDAHHRLRRQGAVMARQQPAQDRSLPPGPQRARPLAWSPRRAATTSARRINRSWMALSIRSSLGAQCMRDQRSASDPAAGVIGRA